MRAEPFDHRLGMGWKIVVAVPAPGRPLNPEQLLVNDRNVIEDLLHVAGLGQRVIVYLYDERRDPDILCALNWRHLVHRETSDQLRSLGPMSEARSLSRLRLIRAYSFQH
jgi:hypothetical protein